MINKRKRRIPLYEVGGFIEQGYDLGDNVNVNAKKADYTWVLNRNLTNTQKSYIMLYYSEKKTIDEIAKIYGVNKSTVSRTIHRGKSNLEKIFTGFAS